MKKPATVLEKYQAIQSIGTEISVPLNVWRLFGSIVQNGTVSIVGDHICLGEDYASLEEARAAVEWYANQLGGKVKWGE